MKKTIWLACLILYFGTMTGCETLKGATTDIANTARNIKDIFVAGKTIHDGTQ